MISSRARRAYDILPRPLQTAALNAYGLRTLARAARHERFLRQIAPSETWTGVQQREYVANRLRGLLEHAINHVPRYRGLRHLLPDLRGSDADVMAVLGQFPRVTRAEILADSSAFLSNAFDRRELVATVTSGTTGTPIKTLLERHALDAGDALWWRRALWAGHERGDWTARLVGDHVVALSETAPLRPYRLSLVDRRNYLSTVHLDERTARAMKGLLQEGSRIPWRSSIATDRRSAAGAFLQGTMRVARLGLRPTPPPAAGARVLDLGPRSGVSPLALHSHGFDVDGCDVWDESAMRVHAAKAGAVQSFPVERLVSVHRSSHGCGVTSADSAPQRDDPAPVA